MLRNLASSCVIHGLTVSVRRGCLLLVTRCYRDWGRGLTLMALCFVIVLAGGRHCGSSVNTDILEELLLFAGELISWMF